MTKPLDLAKISTRGGFNLFWGVAIASIISALGVMIVAGILSEAEYGLFAIALTAPNLIQLIRDLGIDQSLIKYTAQYNQENKPNEIRKLIIGGAVSEIILGFTLSIASLFLSEFFAILLNRPEITFLIQVSSLTIFAQGLIKFADSIRSM